jgi:hypothetical protein
VTVATVPAVVPLRHVSDAVQVRPDPSDCARRIRSVQRKSGPQRRAYKSVGHGSDRRHPAKLGPGNWAEYRANAVAFDSPPPGGYGSETVQGWRFPLTREIAMSGSNSGDGRTSPFDGQGGKGVGDKMASGNNFTTNPGGTRSTQKLPDLVNTTKSQVRAEPANNAGQPAGGLIPAAGAPATRPGGVGTVGNSAKSFRVGG